MDIFKEWIGAIAAAIIFASLCEMLIPAGNIKKYVNLILGIILSITMLRPFSNIKFNNWSDKLFEFERMSAYLVQTELDEEEKNSVIKIYTKKLENAVKDKLSENIDAELKVNIETECDNEKRFGEVNEILVTVIQKEGFKDYRKKIEEILKSDFGISGENIRIKFKTTKE